MITFGIITNSQHHSSTQQNYRMTQILDSIEQEEIFGYEVIIVGDYKTNRAKCIDFDETIKSAWITKKKNIITQEAKNDIIVYMHDYVVLVPGWYEGWRLHDFDWDLGMNIILNKDGTRFRDWCVYKFDGNIGKNGVWISNITGHKPHNISPYLPNYSYNKTKNLYISGTYWIAKKYVMQNEPLNEEFVWGQPEDIEWSLRVLPKFEYTMNTLSTVQLLHQKDPVWSAL